MRNFKKILSLLLCVVLLCTFSISASAETDFTDMPNDATSNWAGENNKKKLVYARPMFEHYETVTSLDIDGVDNFGTLFDIYACGGKLYILDEELGRVVVTDEDFKLIKIIDKLSFNGEEITFVGARGILVDSDETLYIADYAGGRVIISDMNGAVKTILKKPESEMWPETLHYQPVKIVKDNMGYVYVLSEGCYYGAAMYTPEYEFKGFFGANVVTSTVLEAMNNLWDMLFMNNEKRGKTEKKLPYSFVDMELGADGYIYTCTGATSTTGAAAGSVKRLNPTGTNILKDKTGTTVLNSDAVRFATKETVREGVRARGHDVSSVTVDENNFIYLLDVTYGRVYVYDVECNLLNTFGGGVNDGTQYGTFKEAKALTDMNGKIYIIDAEKDSITVFKRNAYGDLVEKAQAMTINGDYVDAEPLWQEVLNLDANSLVAYRGIAKAKILLEDYKGALEYAKLGEDRDTYSRAFEYVRKDFLKDNFLYITIGLVALIAVIVVLLHFKKKYNVVLIKNRKLKIALGTLLHPADTFYEIKRNKGGSVLIATGFLLVWYAFKIIGFSSGFLFNTTDIRNANAWYALAQTFGLVILFTLANWAVCTLMEGKGKLKDIYIVTCYSLIPMIIQAAAQNVLSEVLTLQEANVMSILTYVCIVFTAIILVMGLINLHEYTFGKFIFTTVVTLLAMVLIVFLVFMIAILLQQTKNFVETVYLEAFFR